MSEDEERKNVSATEAIDLYARGLLSVDDMRAIVRPSSTPPKKKKDDGRRAPSTGAATGRVRKSKRPSPSTAATTRVNIGVSVPVDLSGDVPVCVDSLTIVGPATVTLPHGTLEIGRGDTTTIRKTSPRAPRISAEVRVTPDEHTRVRILNGLEEMSIGSVGANSTMTLSF